MIAITALIQTMYYDQILQGERTLTDYEKLNAIDFFRQRIQMHNNLIIVQK